jgi:hypothetical protein
MLPPAKPAEEENRMPTKRRPNRSANPPAARRRRVPPGPRRSVHVALPPDVAKRLGRIALEWDADISFVVAALVERCPIRPAGGEGPTDLDPGRAGETNGQPARAAAE